MLENMAEFVLSKLAESAVSLTVERISDLLIYEASSLGGVREDVMLLQNELRSLQGFLKDADSKQQHDQRLRELAHQVKDVASDAQDVLDIFILKVTSSYIKAFHNKRIRPQINSARSRIQSIINTSMRIYGFKSVIEEGTSSMVELQRHLRRSSPADDGDDDVVSLEGSINALTAELTKEEEEDRLCIVCVVGMGGLGKTTLAKKVYNSVKQHFDCSAWVFISQKYVLRDVLIDIFTQLDYPNENMKFGRSKSGRDILERKKTEREILNALTEHELIDLLKDNLKEKRFLVVLDDIWTIVAWDFLKRAFPKGKKGSKVLFTTRNREVATYGDPWNSPIEPPFLTLEESWELLKRKAFPRDIVGDSCCALEYEELGKEMARKCGGLPLAVVVLRGLLKAKTSVDEWKKVLKDVNSHLNKLPSRQQYEGVQGILALSYYDLPYNLRPWFLYLANFPEDYEIPKRKLVRLWIAEGFILTPTRGQMEQTLEEIGEGYLEELIDRCMVQVDKRDHTGIGVKTCRMHDLMRDLCTSKAIEENFAQIIQQQHEINSKNIASTPAATLDLGSSHSRRLVTHPGCDLQCNTHWACTCFGKHVANASWVEQVHPNLRSVLCLGGTLSLSALKLSNFRMLTVLELRIPGGCKITSAIGNLVHLRYLCLDSSFQTISISTSIFNLRNLHTLDLGNCHFAISARMISRLIRLRHLFLPYKMKEKSNWNDVRIDELKDIVTLKDIPSSVLLRYDALNKLTCLRNIGIRFDGSTDDVERILRSPIVESGRLRSLYMCISRDGRFPSLDSLCSCHNLSKLSLNGKILVGIHSFLQFLPPTLTKLDLWRSHLKQDPMPVLEKLPKLRFLMLGHDAYYGSTMVCSAHGFPKLETLVLYDLGSLRKWTVEKGAMPSLKELFINKISNLEMIPKGLESVTSLKELSIIGMSNSFTEKLQVKNGIEGEDYCIVRHIPSIFIKD